MKFKQKGKKVWKDSLKKNENGRINTYGGSVLWFAEHWANAMEEAMAKGKSLEDCADRLGSEVDEKMGKYGLTGFQYGAAVNILSVCWEHGEELRRWHNLKTQIHNEGERANKKGTVLNPAIMKISKR